MPKVYTESERDFAYRQCLKDASELYLKYKETNPIEKAKRKCDDPSTLGRYLKKIFD